MIRAVLCLAALIALPVQAAEQLSIGRGALQARAGLDLAVVIPEVMRIALTDHPARLRITAEDSARGEVRVPGARVLIVANDHRGYMLQAALDSAFLRATIDGLEAPVDIPAGGGQVPMPPMVGKAAPAPKRVEYRFTFTAGIEPGLYPWPLALSLAHP